MGNKKIPMWAKLNHPRPSTRREFLATGVIPFAAWAVGPSLGSLLLSAPAAEAQAANCLAAAGSGFIPFITLNLSGGPSLASQLVVKDLNGAPLNSYTKLGQGSGPGISFNVTKEFGNVDFAGTAIGGNTQGLVSKFLTGVRDPLANGSRSAALNNTAFVWTAVALGDDTSANQLDISGLVVKMGLSGSKLPNLGTVDSVTGINQMPSLLPPPAPFRVGGVNDLTNALGYAASLNSLSKNQKTALARAISKLSGSQVRRIAASSGATVVGQLIECAGIRNVDLITTGGGDVNPLAVGGSLTTELARIWGIQANDRRSQNAVFACMVYNGISGNASTVNLNMGGYDYHDGTRATGDARDLAAGQVVGKILQTAAFLKKPVFVYVCADGATVSGDSITADSPWMSDRGIAGMQYILAYDPTKRPVTSSAQIGGFNNGQAADGKFPTGTSADLAAQAVFANYAAWNGRMDFLESYRILGDAALRAQTIKLHKG
ncbi:MAG: hypothetical protein KF799_09335 [Bdellovibrionales bacterium]|nr:hypothetical protein [Bdellovibrionales bacterium]